MKPNLIFALASMCIILSCFTTQAQNVKYKDLFVLLSAKQFEKAEPFLEQYLKQNENDPNANLYMGIILEDKVKRNKLLSGDEIDLAISYLSKASKLITENEIRTRDEYYEAYMRRDLRTGKFVIKLADVQLDVENRIKYLQLKKASASSVALLPPVVKPSPDQSVSDEQRKSVANEEKKVENQSLILTVPVASKTENPVTQTLPSNAGKKIAIVIGIKSYKSVPPLANSLNDAMDMSLVLKKQGFQVIEVYDPMEKKEIRNAVIQFNKLLQGQPDGVGMLYYSGHGMQVDGSNYIIPAGATLDIKADVEEQCMNMDYILRSMEETGNQLNIIVLDACRNNPFRSFSRSGERGLSMVNAPKGSYIVYSTKPGSVASDGNGRNGLFTSKLLKYISAPDLNLFQVFQKVAAEVAQDSNDAQRPWISADYTGDFYFSKK
jgi:tetratricopeptide (TPR) repeat protein